MKYLFFISLLFTIHTSQGQSLAKMSISDVEKLMQNNDTTYVVNFWATFCAPCIAEIPDMLSVAKKYQNQKVKFYFISIDFKENYPQKIKSFIANRNWTSNFAWLNETNADYFCPKIDSSWSGSIPATMVVNKAHNYKAFWEETIMAPELEAIIEKSLIKK